MGGSPLTLYHGTREDITAFELNHPTRKDHGWLGQGVYLASDPVTAFEYAQRKMGEHGPSVMPLYANVRNPYVATEADRARVRKGKAKASRAFTEELKARGHDGVVLDLGEGGIELVAFEPTQVKSATGITATSTRPTRISVEWLLIGSVFVVLLLCFSFFASIADDLKKAHEET